MLSPNPLSLLCALLLCIPLALVFTITTPNPTITTPKSNFNSNTTNTTLTIAPSKTFEKTETIQKTLTVHIPSTIPTLKPNKTQIPKTPFSPNTTSSNSPPLSPIQVDYDDDKLLLKLASQVNPNPKANSPKKLAFMFLTTTSLPLQPLWQLYFDRTQPNLFNIYVHVDPRAANNSLFRGTFAHRAIPSKPTRRLTPTLASAARRLLAHALLDDPLNSHFALLSASCIPLHSFDFTYRNVISSRESFVEILDGEGSAWGRWAARGEKTMLPEVTFGDFRIGSQFWVVTRKHARIIVSDTRLRAKFKLPCLRADTCYPEENYFPTLLNMVDPRGIVPATLTHVDWTGRHDGHPRAYSARDVGPELIRRLRSDRPRYGDEKMNGSDSSVMKFRDRFLFVRKFSPKCLQPLMSIASDVIFRD